jgi:hypothetical protein
MEGNAVSENRANRISRARIKIMDGNGTSKKEDYNNETHI